MDVAGVCAIIVHRNLNVMFSIAAVTYGYRRMSTTVGRSVGIAAVVVIIVAVAVAVGVVAGA